LEAKIMAQKDSLLFCKPTVPMPGDSSGEADGSVLYEKADVMEKMDGAFAESLIEALDVREHETGSHSKRVACHTLVLARRFITDPRQLRVIYWGALLHDIGKIGVSDAVLLKNEALTEIEWGRCGPTPTRGTESSRKFPVWRRRPT
jgi:response regulator RpfG family c-di-GMP phosphodiesterase